MNLQELIKRLRAEDSLRVAKPGFGAGGSYRGYYECIAFEPTEQSTVQEMLDHAEACIGAVFEGYKGGAYCMGPQTDVYIARYGEYAGDEDAITEDRLTLMLRGDWQEEVSVLRARVAELEQSLRLIIAAADSEWASGGEIYWCETVSPVVDAARAIAAEKP